MSTPPAPPGPATAPNAADAVRRAVALGEDLRKEIGRVIVGQHELVDQVIACLLAGGHVLLEGVPGLGKTVLLKSLADSLAMELARVQCTPDLMPADILGTTLLAGERAGSFQPGPVFTNLLLADEINRATPKSQAALLEAMAERAVTLGGVTRPLPDPFMVMATQNPVDQEGTYPLPEAQMDRFIAKVLVLLPPPADLVEILTRTTGGAPQDVSRVAGAEDVRQAQRLTRAMPVAGHVLRYAADLITATHPRSPTATEDIARFVTLGASPRGAQALILLAKATALLAGRTHVAVDDVVAVALPALRHRLILGYEAAAARISADDLVAGVLAHVPPPEPTATGAATRGAGA